MTEPENPPALRPSRTDTVLQLATALLLVAIIALLAVLWIKERRHRMTLEKRLVEIQQRQPVQIPMDLIMEQMSRGMRQPPKTTPATDTAPAESD